MAGHLGRFVVRLPRPTRSAALLLLLAAILELLGRMINSTGVTVASAAAVGAVISDALLTPGVRLGRIHRRVPNRMTVGVPTMVEITIDAHTRRRFGSRRSVVLIDQPTGLGSGRVVTPMLRAGEQAVAHRPAVPVRRGHFIDGGTIVVEAFSPLGGFVRRTTRKCDGDWYVHPAAAPPMQLPEPAGGELLGTTASRRSGSGTDFFGIREWRGGDPRSAIHWRASARRDQLVVLERERPGRPALVVVVGAGGDDDAWEGDLARLAATAVRALRSGRPVVAVSGSDVAAPNNPRDLLDWFAAVAPSAAPDVDAMRSAMRGAGRDATLLWLGAAAMPPGLQHAARASGVSAVVAMTASGRTAG